MSKLIQVQYGRSVLPLEGFSMGRGYTYRADESIEIGDIVEVPATLVNPLPQEATVVAIGSNYMGDVVSVNRLVAKASEMTMKEDENDNG